MLEMILMTETPLHWLTINELSQRIRHGVLSPVELTEYMLSRLKALDGTLHAFKLVTRERAQAQAQAAELSSRPDGMSALARNSLRCQGPLRRQRSTNDSWLQPAGRQHRSKDSTVIGT